MKSVFIVLGVTGENEQQRSWLVKAFPSEREALAFVDRLESTYESAEDEEDLDNGMEEQLTESMRALDENFELDPETGTEYSIVECPFESSTKSESRPQEGRSPQRSRKPPRR